MFFLQVDNDIEPNNDDSSRKTSEKPPNDVGKKVAKKPLEPSQSPLYHVLEGDPKHDFNSPVYDRLEDNKQPLSIAHNNNLPLYEVLQNRDTSDHQPSHRCHTKTSLSGAAFQSHNKKTLNNGFETEENEYEI